jgi:hypothetical protein
MRMQKASTSDRVVVGAVGRGAASDVAAGAESYCEAFSEEVQGKLNESSSSRRCRYAGMTPRAVMCSDMTAACGACFTSMMKVARRSKQSVNQVLRGSCGRTRTCSSALQCEWVPICAFAWHECGATHAQDDALGSGSKAHDQVCI